MSIVVTFLRTTKCFEISRIQRAAEKKKKKEYIRSKRIISHRLFDVVIETSHLFALNINSRNGVLPFPQKTPKKYSEVYAVV